MSSSRSAASATPMHWALEELGDVATDRHHPEPATNTGIDLAAIERAAWERGYQDGQMAGVQSEAARLRTALSSLDDALLALQGDAEAWVANARENICALAIAVARQLVMREVTTDPSIVSTLAQQALAEVPMDHPVVGRIHPDDLAILQSLPDDGEAGLRRSQLQWVADPRVHRGGCLLEGRDRIIDGRIDTGLERLYRKLAVTDA